MAGKFLNLTFHGAGTLTGEDLRFKDEAIKSGLISGDAMDEAGPASFLSQHPGLLATGKQSNGLDVATGSGREVITLGRVGLEAWMRPDYQPARKSVFGQWLKKVFDVPIEVLVLGGHHTQSYVWGSEVHDGPRREVHCAFYPDFEKKGEATVSVLRALHTATTPGDFLREGPFDVSATFKNCRLLVIFGCNGATEHIFRWRDCITKAAGKPPFILGWFEVHAMVRDRRNQFLSPLLWPALKQVAANAGGSGFDFLHKADQREHVLNAWFKSMAKAFPKPSDPKLLDQSHLVFATKKVKGETLSRGAGAIDPDKNIYRAKDLQGNFE